MTLLAQIVEASQRVGAASSRLTKVRELASTLRSLTPDEIETAVHFMSGDLSQGRIGIAYKALQAAASSPAAHEATLSIADVDQSLSAIAGIRGSGSAARRTQTLHALFSKATAAEQHF